MIMDTWWSALTMRWRDRGIGFLTSRYITASRLDFALSEKVFEMLLTFTWRKMPCTKHKTQSFILWLHQSPIDDPLLDLFDVHRTSCLFQDDLKSQVFNSHWSTLTSTQSKVKIWDHIASDNWLKPNLGRVEPREVRFIDNFSWGFTSERQRDTSHTLDKSIQTNIL